MTREEREKYKIQREHEIEAIALVKAARLLGIEESLFILVQQDNEARKALYDKVDITFGKTPDFAITDGSEKYANQLLLVEVNEPGGGLLRDYGIGDEIAESMKTAPLSNGMDGEVNRVLINKPDSNFDEEVINKLQKTYKKYSFKRSNDCPVSVNTGLIFCMGNEPNKLNELPDSSPFHFNLSHGQFMPLIFKTIKELSDGNLNYKDVIQNCGKVLSFEFCDSYKYMGFVMFIGGHAAENQNYLFVNKRFLNAKSCALAKILLKTKVLNNINMLIN